LDTILVEPENTALIFIDDLLYDGTQGVIVRNFCRRPSRPIAQSVEIIARHAFTECESVCDISFQAESKLRAIESYAFSTSCIHSISIPRLLEIIPGFAFYDCKFLEVLEFEEASNLKSVEEFAFLSCMSLAAVQLPWSVEFVDFQAFPDDCEVTTLPRTDAT
jgi:hypothetical protein